MLKERMIELILLQLFKIDSNFRSWLKNNYNIDKIDLRYKQLVQEFLTDYALNRTEKSE